MTRFQPALTILQELGIRYDLGFIMVNPYTTLDEIRQDIDFLRQADCGPDWRHMNSLSVFPGMPLVKKLEEDNLLRSSSLSGYQYGFVDKKVQKFAGTMNREIERRFHPMLSKLVDLQGQIAMAGNQQDNAQLLESVRRDFQILYSDFGKLVGDFLNNILDSAEGDEHCSSQADRRRETLIEHRLAELSERALGIRKASAL